MRDQLEFGNQITKALWDVTLYRCLQADLKKQQRLDGENLEGGDARQDDN